MCCACSVCIRASFGLGCVSICVSRICCRVWCGAGVVHGCDMCCPDMYLVSVIYMGGVVCRRVLGWLQCCPLIVCVWLLGIIYVCVGIGVSQHW